MQDGFFVGELMNGERGLVPSNFVERIAEEEAILKESDEIGLHLNFNSIPTVYSALMLCVKAFHHPIKEFLYFSIKTIIFFIYKHCR